MNKRIRLQLSTNIKRINRLSTSHRNNNAQRRRRRKHWLNVETKLLNKGNQAALGAKKG